MANPTTNELLAAISVLAPIQVQENADLLSSRVLQKFNLTRDL
jgi:hypothetical protein